MSDFLQVIKDNYSKEEYLLIEYALKFATEAHKNQYRRTGEEYRYSRMFSAAILAVSGLE